MLDQGDGSTRGCLLGVGWEWVKTIKCVTYLKSAALKILLIEILLIEILLILNI